MIVSEYKLKSFGKTALEFELSSGKIHILENGFSSLRIPLKFSCLENPMDRGTW